MYLGDDEVLDVSLKDSLGESVEVGEGETVTLTVRELPSRDSAIIFSSTSSPGSNRIVINHKDTADADSGEYSADIQLLTTDGRRKTVWPAIDEKDPPNPKRQGTNRGNFVLLSEVTIE